MYIYFYIYTYVHTHITYIIYIIMYIITIIIVKLILCIYPYICQAQRRNKHNTYAIYTRGQAKSSLERGTTDMLWWKNKLKQICFEIITKDIYSLRRFNRNRELIPIC